MNAYNLTLKRRRQVRTEGVLRLRREGKSFTQIGVLLGISRQRAWQLAKKQQAKEAP